MKHSYHCGMHWIQTLLSALATAAVHTMVVIAAPKQSKVAQLKKLTGSLASVVRLHFISEGCMRILIAFLSTFLHRMAASNVSAWIPTEGGKPPPRAPALGLAVLKTTKGMATVTTTTSEHFLLCRVFQ